MNSRSGRVLLRVGDSPPPFRVQTTSWVIPWWVKVTKEKAIEVDEAMDISN
jgi:hypothetical protein